MFFVDGKVYSAFMSTWLTNGAQCGIYWYVFHSTELIPFD